MGNGTYRAADINRAITYIGPHGNLSRKTAKLTVPIAAATGETIDLMKLPNGAEIVDVFLNVIGTPGTGVTMALGIAQIPGGLDTKVDADALIVATAAVAPIILRRNKTAIANAALSLDDDYLIQILLGGTTPDAAFEVELTVIYENRGTL